jgi:hypothetical protein
VHGGEVAIIKPDGVDNKAFENRILTALGKRSDTRSLLFSIRNAGCGRFILTCRGDDPKPAKLKGDKTRATAPVTASGSGQVPEAIQTPENRVQANVVRPEAALPPGLNPSANLGNRLHDPDVDVIRRGIESKINLLRSKIGHMEGDLARENARLGDLEESLRLL